MIPIEKGIPVPTVQDWEIILSQMEKGDSFLASDDDLFSIHSVATRMGLQVISKRSWLLFTMPIVRVWRVD